MALPNDEPSALPDVPGQSPMLPEEFDALVRATCWTALTPYVDPDGSDGPLDRLPLASPFHGAIQVGDFQLVPLLKAMRMPRVSLLLADDVGIGKTIEAGLVLTELILRRRVRRILVVCPASLRSQRQKEMREKFALDFEVVDRPATHAPQKRLGLDANPHVPARHHLVRLPEAGRRAGTVPGGEPAGRGVAASAWWWTRRATGAVLARRRQRRLEDAPAHRAVVRAPALPHRHAPQRPHTELHGPPGVARPGALHA
jgi:hypothetical protein